MWGILGALGAEVQGLVAELEQPEVIDSFGITVRRGKLVGVDVLIARSGVGKVNAALAAAALLANGATRLVFTGVAGSVASGQCVGDVVVGTNLVQHDVDVTALGRPPGELLGEPLAWPCDEEMSSALFASAQRVVLDASVHRGRIASGDQFIASHDRILELRRLFDAVAVEMEGAAVAQVCHRAKVPFAIVRVLSDSADSDAAVDFPRLLEKASITGSDIVKHFLAAKQ